MKRLYYFTAIALSLVLFSCKKDSADTGNGGGGTPAPGSTRTITVSVIYISGQIEGTQSWATWPVASFAVDDNAVKYKVKFYGFNGTFPNPPEGATYTWNKGDLPPTPYNVYPSTKDIKDHTYYVALGRTWCSGCTQPNPVWLVNYQTGFGTPKADITFTY